MRYSFKRSDYYIMIETAMIAGICFGHLAYAICLIPFAMNRRKVYRNNQKRKKTNQLREAFIQHISFLSSALFAGYSIDNSILHYAKRLKEIPCIEPQYEAFIEQESLKVQQGGSALLYFRRLRESYTLPEIISFCEAIEIGYQMGGPITPVFREAVTMTKSHYHTERDIEAMIAEKRLEASIISWMPYGVIFFLRLTMGDLMEPIFTRMNGLIFLQILICLFEMSSWMTQKICDIRLSQTVTT